MWRVTFRSFLLNLLSLFNGDSSSDPDKFRFPKECKLFSMKLVDIKKMINTAKKKKYFLITTVIPRRKYTTENIFPKT